MLLYNNLTIQLVALFFLIMLVIQYRKTMRLPLLSYKYYDTLIALVVFNMALNFLAVTTEVYSDMVTEYEMRFAHQLYAFSVVALMASFFCYVESRGSKRHRSLRGDIALVLPLIISVPAVILLDIDVYNDGTLAYAKGPMMAVIPANIFIYSILIIIDLIRKKGKKSDKQVILSGVLIWIIGTAVQMKFNYVRLATCASVILAWLLFLSFQNPQELVDDETQTFNSRAYGMVVNEYMSTGKSFYIISIVFADISAMYNLLGHDASNELIRDSVSYFKKKMGKLIFSVGNNTLSIFCDSSVNLEEYEKYIKEYFNMPHAVNQIAVDVNASIYILKCPDYAPTTDDIFRITQHIRDYFENNGEDEIIYVNEEILAKTRRIEAIRALLTDAIENDGFDVMYQPIFDLKHRCFASAEALVRLRYTGDLGYISPEEYIPIAEKTGLISEIGSIVFTKVCRFASLNSVEKLGIRYIEVNLSGVQAADGTISTQLRSIMDSYGIRAGFINLEITETAVIDYQDILKDNMEKLRAIGCTFSMDDFGTGYSNLSSLAELNYDIIKIDKSLLWPCFDGSENSESSKIILENIVSLIHQMGAKIVCEGTETREQLDYLDFLGVDYIQGYYFSKPLNEIDFIAFIDKKRYIKPV